MILKKKAVSPLIATVLLISFAVALGAVVMAFGSKTFEDKISKGCLSIDLKISNVCYDGSGKIIRIDLNNKGDIDIESLNLWVVGNRIFKSDVEDSIGKGGSLKRSIEYDYDSYGDIKEVIFIPSIKKRSQLMWCLSNTASSQQISSC